MPIEYIKIDPAMLKFEAEMIQEVQMSELTSKGLETMTSEFIERNQPMLDSINVKIDEIFGKEVPPDVSGYHQSLLEKFDLLKSGTVGPLFSVAKTAVAIAEIRALQLTLGIN